MRHSMPIPTEKSTPEEWLTYANWLRFTENARLAKKVALFRETGNYVAVEDFLFEIEENEKEAQYIESKYAPIVEYDSVLNGNVSRTFKRTQRRKQNKKNKNRDRIHGRRHGGAHGGVDFRYADCNPFCTKDSYYDGMHKDNGKRHNNAKKLSSVIAKEKEDARLFTGFGELLEDINYLEDRIHIYEEDIKDLEYEKAFGYLTEHGEEFLEDYKKELKELKEYKQYKEILLRTATR